LGTDEAYYGWQQRWLQWHHEQINWTFLDGIRSLHFIGRNVHMFHHISTSMPLTIMMIIAWNFVYNLVILVLFVNCTKLPLVSNWSPWHPGMEANIRMWNFNHVSTP
jgi:hypothetical protein